MRITATYPEMDVKILLARPVWYLVVICGQHCESRIANGQPRKIVCSQCGFKDTTLVSSMRWKRVAEVVTSILPRHLKL